MRLEVYDVLKVSATDENIKELYNMCKNNDFPIERAEKLINVIDVNKPFNDPLYNKSLTTVNVRNPHTNKM